MFIDINLFLLPTIPRTAKGRAIKSLLFQALFLVSFVCLAESQTNNFIIEFEQNAESPGQSFFVKSESDTLSAMQMVNIESLQSKPTEITNTNSYSGSDSPPDDKPCRPGLRESLTTVLESVSWQLLYATNEVIGYRLFLTLQEGSYQPRLFPWEPVMTTVVVGWLSRSHWNPELPIFNQLDEQESEQQRELQIITLMDRPYGGYSSSTLPWGWGQPFNMFSTFTGHSYSSIANYPFRYGDDPDRPPPWHTQDENCPLQPCCHQRHCILRPATLANQHGDDCCADCLGSSITRQPIASTQCDSTPDQTIVCRTYIDLQTGGPESNPHSVNVGSVESETITQKAGSTTQAQGKPPPAKKKKHSRTVKTHQARAERTYQYHCDQPDCTYLTDWSANLERHKKTHQARAERTYQYHCDQQDCPYQTDLSAHLEQHKKTHQARAKRTYQYHCDQPDCPYQTDWSSNLKQHKKTHQSMVERTYKYLCDQPDCPYQTDRRSNLEKHKKTHQVKAERTYKYHCEQPDCSYQADQRNHLEQHKKKHQARAERTYQYHCNQPDCPYQTDLSANLEQHKKTHQAKAERTYKYHCGQSDCPYQTDWSTSLERHKKTHQPKAERTYQYHCNQPDCPYQTDWNFNLKQHKKTHQANREKE